MKLFKTTLTLVALCCLTLAVHGQQKSPFSSDAAVKAKTEMMAKDLSLDAGQKAQLMNLNKDQAAKNGQRMKNLKAASKKTDKGVNPSAANKALADAKKANLEYEKAVRKMLRPDQAKKWDETYGQKKSKSGK